MYVYENISKKLMFLYRKYICLSIITVFVKGLLVVQDVNIQLCSHKPYIHTILHFQLET